MISSKNDVRLYKFTLSHFLEKPYNKSFSNCPQFKLFGFFDGLSIQEINETGAPLSRAGTVSNKDAATSAPTAVACAPKLQRTLTAFGEKRHVDQILKLGAVKPDGSLKDGAFLALVLVKLGYAVSHENFHAFCSRLLGRTGGAECVGDTEGATAYLTCLDAPDVIVLRAFPVAGRGVVALDDLLKWAESLGTGQADAIGTGDATSGVSLFGGSVERQLTLVGWNLNIENLTDLPDGTDADGAHPTALVRVLDQSGGKGIKSLVTKLDSSAEGKQILPLIQESVGYYDFHMSLDIRDAAWLLLEASEYVGAKWLTTSICFLSNSGDFAKRMLGRGCAEGGLSSEGKELLRQIREAHQMLRGPVPEAAEIRSDLTEVIGETIDRFDRLHSTGLIPGSRLLLWTARDAAQMLLKEQVSCVSRIGRKPPNEHSAWSTEFGNRQVAYRDLFRGVCDELDRRVSLSLAAHARFFPSSLDVPIKVIAAVDMIGRLTAASSRCYRCRASKGILQVFTAKADNPSQFDTQRPNSPFSDGAPAPTIMLTRFSPQMAQHFYLATFMHMHEVAQCVMLETLDSPSFTSLVMAHAQVERIAALTTLAIHWQESAPDRIPNDIRLWVGAWLHESFVKDESWKGPHPFTDPSYFSENGNFGESWPYPDPHAEAGNLWNTQANVWRVHREKPHANYGEDIFKVLYRDARTASRLFKVDERFDLLKNLCRAISAEYFPAVSAAAESSKEESVEKTLWSAISAWSKTCSYAEYLELASLVPFLRLFESDKNLDSLLQTFCGLIVDFDAVWKSSLDPRVRYDVARRFVVALAAAYLHAEQSCPGILYQQASAAPWLNDLAESNQDCQSAASDRVISGVLSLCADQIRKRIGAGRVSAELEQTWNHIADGIVHPSWAAMGYSFEVTHPLLIRGMVRFLVRLLHVHAVDGENVIKRSQSMGKNETHHKESVVRFNTWMRGLFAERNRRDKGSGYATMPLDHITELWSMQYPLTKDHSYDFKLKDALDLLDEVRATTAAASP